MKILLVEDEPKVAAFIVQGLEESGHEVQLAYDGQLGLRFATKDVFDMMIFDVIIPGINGLELCKEVRKQGIGTPILLLTALGTTEDKVTGLDSGADDYLVKPFEFKELLARIRSFSRRSSNSTELSNKLIYHDLELDLNKKQAIRSGKEIALTAKEFSLLEYLMRNRERVVSRVQISENVWDIHFDTGTNVVDVYMNLLRKKVDKDFDTKLIQTRIGHGYVLQA
ncbi:MAG: response regulator transcription factor [Flavobacteriales bacterium]|nr:response regulator transcription factor [Flavobacteriales bacterium]